MNALLQVPRTLYNVLLLRGRRKVTRLFLLLILCVLVVTVLKQGLCILNPDLCKNGGRDSSYRRPLDDFEVGKREHIDQHISPQRSIMEGNGAKSHPEEGQKTSEQDGGELVMNHKDSRQERTGESNDGHARNVEGGGRVQDEGEENQDNGDKDEAVQDNMQDRQTDLAGVNAPVPVGQSQGGIPQSNPSKEAANFPSEVAGQNPDSNPANSKTATQIQQVPGVAATPPNHQPPGAIPNGQLLSVSPGGVNQNALGPVPLVGVPPGGVNQNTLGQVHPGGVNQNTLGQVPLAGVPPVGVNQNTLGQVPPGGVNQNALGQVPPGGVNQNALGQVPLPGIPPGGVNQNILGQVPLPGPGPAQQAGMAAVDKRITPPQNQNQAVQQFVKNAAPPFVAPGVMQPSNPPPVRKPTVATTAETDPPTLALPGVRMNMDEVAKAIRSGQMCRTVCPPFVWSEWSPCSKACGQGRRYRKAIYDFVCQVSEKCPLNRIEESICDIPCRFDPDKYGGPGGLDMYPINPLNPPIYPEDSKYRCGHWLVEYEKLHREIVTGKRPPAYLLYTSGRGDYPTAGGMAGRIRGISTVFFMAVLLERALLIEWVDPPGLDEYLEPKSFNWADLTPIQRLKRGPIRDIGSWRSAKDTGRSSQWYMNTNFSTYFKFPVEVVQGHRYDFTYAVLRNPGLMPKAYELGVDRIKCRICCAWDMLFKMTPRFEKEMDVLIKSLGVPKRSLMTIQARTRSDDIQGAVALTEQYVSCAVKAGRELKILHKMVWVPVFNNRLVVHIVAKKYADRMKTPIRIDSATRTVHTHLGNLPPDTEVNVVKGVQDRTFKEFFLMMNSSVIVRTKGYVGSFGNIADAIRRFYAAPGSIYTYTAGGGCSRFPDNYKIE